MTSAVADASKVKAHRRLRPRDAATLIVVDQSSGEPRVLLGRRRADLVFMPGRFVFPGGRVDLADRHIAPDGDLQPGNIDRLMVAMRGNPSAQRARALALAAVRETFEEAGLVIGVPAAAAAGLPKSAGWQEFLALGFRPNLAQLTFFARAITPPGRPRRFDTRFFCVPSSCIAHRIAITGGELSDLEWHSIAQARTLELPNITRVVLEDLGERLAGNAMQASELPVPFYHRRNGAFVRALITGSGLLS